MPRYQDTNRCLGYAHIRFNDEEAYKNALGKNGNKIGNRYLTISPARG
jgi:nucleolin